MPVIKCAGCGRTTNTAVSSHIDRKPYDGKADECYLAAGEGKRWMKGCAYDRADAFTKTFCDKLLAMQGGKK